MSSPLIVSCTNRPNSKTLQVTRLYHARLAEMGLPHTLVDLQSLPNELLFTDLYGKRSDAFKPIEEQFLVAEKMLWVVPEYNGSFPGVVKVLVDALPRVALSSKRIALVGVSSGQFGNLRGLEHLNGVLNYCQSVVMPYRAHYMKIEDWVNAQGEPTDAFRAEMDNQLKRYLSF